MIVWVPVKRLWKIWLNLWDEKYELMVYPKQNKVQIHVVLVYNTSSFVWYHLKDLEIPVCMVTEYKQVYPESKFGWRCISMLCTIQNLWLGTKQLSLIWDKMPIYLYMRVGVCGRRCKILNRYNVLVLHLHLHHHHHHHPTTTVKPLIPVAP